jgi:methyl-accepting chemotaxis protein
MTPIEIMWLAIGAAALIIAIGLAYLCARLARFIDHRDVTMGKVDVLLDGLQKPVLDTLDHVGGVAGSVDEMVARVDRVTQTLEQTANSVAKAADAAQSAVSPTVANVVGVVAGISKGAQKFFRSRQGNGASQEQE